MSSTNRVLNQLAFLFLIGSVALAAIYAVVFLLDPFGGVAIARATLTPSITLTPSSTRPPTWTPTATPGPTDTPGPSLTPTETGTATPTRPPIVTPTFTPTPTPPGPPRPTFSTFKYTKTNDAIVFRSDVYGAECGTWMGVGGQVLDITGDPLPGVTIVGWGGPIPDQNKRAFVSGSSNRINSLYGSPAAYEIFIGAPGEYDFIIQVYENGQPVSDLINLRMRLDCRADLAVVNIQRNH